MAAATESNTNFISSTFMKVLPMNELLESIVNNFINGNMSDCKKLIREYADANDNVYDLLDYFKSVNRLSDNGNDSFTNIIYRALLDN